MFFIDFKLNILLVIGTNPGYEKQVRVCAENKVIMQSFFIKNSPDKCVVVYSAVIQLQSWVLDDPSGPCSPPVSWPDYHQLDLKCPCWHRDVKTTAHRATTLNSAFQRSLFLGPGLAPCRSAKGAAFPFVCLGAGTEVDKCRLNYWLRFAAFCSCFFYPSLPPACAGFGPFLMVLASVQL